MGSGPIHRREFLRRGAAAGLGAGLLPLAGGFAGAAASPRVRARSVLGRTGLEVSDVGFGGSALAGDEALVRHALGRGIRYFDTAESYRGGASEETLGRVLAGERERVVLASKVKCGARTTRGELMEALEGSLRRLRTDRIDVYFNHAVNSIDRLRNPEWPEFVARAKQAGKIRFSGMSGHGGRLVECLDEAVDEGQVDVVLVAHNFGQDPAFHQKITRSLDFVAVQPDLPRVLRKARAGGVGVVAMKTLRGARLNDMRPYEQGGSTFAQAALRWVLASGLADSLVVTMKSPEQVDEYLGASGSRAPAAADLGLLERYEALFADTQCRYGCSRCESACPHGVPIAEVLRARMVDRDYREPERARAEYAGLEVNAEACLSCAERPCAGACAYGVRISELMEPAHRRLVRGG